jgi:hypothetical protein
VAAENAISVAASRACCRTRGAESDVGLGAEPDLEPTGSVVCGDGAAEAMLMWISTLDVVVLGKYSSELLRSA